MRLEWPNEAGIRRRHGRVARLEAPPLFDCRAISITATGTERNQCPVRQSWPRLEASAIQDEKICCSTRRCRGFDSDRDDRNSRESFLPRSSDGEAHEMNIHTWILFNGRTNQE